MSFPALMTSGRNDLAPWPKGHAYFSCSRLYPINYLRQNESTPITRNSYIPLHSRLIALASQLQVPDLCLQISQGTEVSAWTTRAQQSVRIFNVEGITIVPDRGSKTATAQLGDPWVDGRLRAFRLATGHVNLVHAFESFESFSTRDVGRIFLVQLKEREAGFGVLLNTSQPFCKRLDRQQETLDRLIPQHQVLMIERRKKCEAPKCT